MVIHFKQPNKHIQGDKNPNWRGGKRKCKCSVCGDLYFVFPCKIRNNRSKFCSKKCFYARHPHQPVRDGNGYMWIFKPNHPYSTQNGYVREHRIVMEKILGRILKPAEVVNHKNHIKSDNRPENLEIFPNQYEHMIFHHRKEER
jgi:hypothetical protein